MKWLPIYLYKYLFINNTGFHNILCRAKGHEDIVFYNYTGNETRLSL